MPPRTGKSWDDIREEGYERGCRHMRGPSPCGVEGHVEANWIKTNEHDCECPCFDIVEHADDCPDCDCGKEGTYECSACAQQRELREALLKYGHHIEWPSPCSYLLHEDKCDCGWYKARRALGEKP